MLVAKRGPAASRFLPHILPGDFAGPPRQFGGEPARVVVRVSQDLDVAPPVDRGRLGPGFLEQAVEIAAPEAEGADRGPAGMAAAGQPGPALGVQIKGRVARGQRLDGLADLDRRRQHLVMERQRRLDQARGARCRLGVPHLRFDRAQGAPGRARIRVPVHLLQGLQLDRVAHPSPGAMGLDQLDRAW